MTIIDLSSYLFIKNQPTTHSIKRSASLRSVKKVQQVSKLYQINNNQSIILHKPKRKGSFTYTFDSIIHQFQGVLSWISSNIQNKLDCLILTNNFIDSNLQQLIVLLGRNFLVSQREVTLLVNSMDQSKVYSFPIRYLSEIKDSINKLKSNLKYQINLIIDSRISISIKKIRDYQGTYHDFTKMVNSSKVSAVLLLTLIKQPFSTSIQDTIKTLDIAIIKLRQLKLLNPQNKQKSSTNFYKQTMNLKQLNQYELEGSTKQMFKYNSQLVKPLKKTQNLWIQSSNDSLDASQKTQRNETYKQKLSYQQLKSQNTNLQRRISQMQKQFAKQSSQYVQKTKQKIKILKQQIHKLTFQNRKIKIDYEVMEGQFNQLKRQFEQTLTSRKQYEEEAEKIRRQYNDKELKQLQNQISILLTKIDTMQEQFFRQRHIYEKRSQLQIQQLSTKYHTLKQKYISQLDSLEQTNKNLTNQLQLMANRCKLLELTTHQNQRSKRPSNK